MNPINHRGLFITIEGIDGIGKTVQLNSLAERLSADHSVFVTKEPGDDTYGSTVGAGIRRILFGGEGTRILAPGVGDMLFLADHIQNVHNIVSAMNENKIVVADRYADSQFAYAASSSKKAPDWANEMFVRLYGVVPDLTILLVARGAVITAPAGKDLMDGFASEDIGWALERANRRRGKEAGKQDGKGWNNVHEQSLIQAKYIQNLQAEPRTKIIGVWESSTERFIRHEILNAVAEVVERWHASPEKLLVINPLEYVPALLQDL